MALRRAFVRALLISATILSAGSSPDLAQDVSSASPNERDVGIELYKVGNNESAIQALRNAVRKDKGDVDAWYYLGLAFNKGGDIKGARKAFETVLKLRPTFAEAHLGLAYTLFRSAKPKEAVSHAQQALNVSNGAEAAHYIIAAVRLREGSYSTSLQEAEASLKINPNYPWALLVKSQALFGLYQDETALSLEVRGATKRTTSTKTDPRSYIIDAAQALSRFIELQPNDKDLIFWRDQLETLRVYALERSVEEAAFTPKEVTIKARVLTKPEPQYTELARSNAVTGAVILRAVFGSDGKVRHIIVIRRLPDGLTEAAISAARRIKFVPAVKDGHRVSQFIQLEYNFNLY